MSERQLAASAVGPASPAAEPARAAVAAAGEAGDEVRQVGRYTVFTEIAAGGMATVHLARLAGPVGFSRVVAVKRLHPHLVRDPEFTSMFIDEARLAARVRHPNVVPILDVVVEGPDIYLVMDYVEGEALGSLASTSRKRNQPIPLPVAVAIMADALHGLHAAHEARDVHGQLLNIVHRDVSPPNILVGLDGVSRLLDFGVAKALDSVHDTRPGVVKGKSSYMAPEQIRGEPLTRRADVFSASAVLWELVTSRRLFAGTSEHERMFQVLNWKNGTRPSALAPGLPAELDAVLSRGLAPEAGERFATALELADALLRVVPPASARAVGRWVAQTAAVSIARRAEMVKRVESSGAGSGAGAGAGSGAGAGAGAGGGGTGTAARRGQPISMSLRAPAGWRTWALLAGATALVLLVGIRAASRSRRVGPEETPALMMPAREEPAEAVVNPAGEAAPSPDPSLRVTVPGGVGPLPPPPGAPAHRPRPVATAHRQTAGGGATPNPAPVVRAAEVARPRAVEPPALPAEPVKPVPTRRAPLVEDDGRVPLLD